MRHSSRFRPFRCESCCSTTKIATLPDLKRAPGTDVDLTVFRKLKQLDYLTSYSHRVAVSTRFVRSPISEPMVCGPASRPGSPATVPSWHTAEAFIRNSVAGYFAEETVRHPAYRSAGCLTPTRPAGRGSLRELISGLFLYTSMNPVTRQQQRLTRRGNQSVPTVVDASRLEVSPDEMKAAIILFYQRLLDEQQRRLCTPLWNR